MAGSWCMANNAESVLLESILTYSHKDKLSELEKIPDIIMLKKKLYPRSLD